MLIRAITSALCVWLFLVPASSAQERVALFYSLPEDGAWVEYAWRTGDMDGSPQGNRLRLSSVGQTIRDKTPCRWVEIHKETHRGDQVTHQLRKLLIAEKKDSRDKPGSFRVLAGFAQRGLDTPATPLTPRRIQELGELGFEDSKEGLVTRAENAEVRTGLGMFRARHVEGQTRKGTRTLIYRAWLTPEVPFGWAKIEIVEQTGQDAERVAFSAVALRKGKEARSEMKTGDFSK